MNGIPLVDRIRNALEREPDGLRLRVLAERVNGSLTTVAGTLVRLRDEGEVVHGGYGTPWILVERQEPVPAASGWPKKLPCLVCNVTRVATHAGDRLHDNCRAYATRGYAA